MLREPLCERNGQRDSYVLVDDKLRILAAVKQFWGGRVTTVSARQGSYAHDATMVAAFPPAYVTIERIADLLEADLPRPLLTPPVPASSLESTR